MAGRLYMFGCSKFWFAVIKHSFKKQQKVSCLDHCFIDTKNHHKKEARWRIFSDTEPHRRGKKKCLFGQRALEVWLGAWRCIVDISEGCCQPDWKKGFFESTSLESQGVFWEHHVEYIQMRFIHDVYSIEEYVFEKEANTQSVSKRSANDKSSTFQIFIKLITSPMCPAGRCWNCTKSDLLELTNVESPHGLWCWTTSSEHPWKQLHVVGVMHCPDIKPENSGEDQFKGKSWVPLGEYPRYKATKKKLLIWDYIMLV